MVSDILLPTNHAIPMHKSLSLFKVNYASKAFKNKLLDAYDENNPVAYVSMTLL